MGVLADIVRSKRAEVAAFAATPARRVDVAPRGAVVGSALARTKDGPLRLITEIKRRSPSAGVLSTRLSVAERAVVYARNGAAMISVLCDGPFFDGSFDHLADARRTLDAAGLAVPLLAKEFVLHERQLEEAAASGADAVLLIARIVTHEELARLCARSLALGLEPLVEVVSEDELGSALDAGARVIGVNARDLDTLAMDHTRAAQILAAIPDDRIALHLSGLKTAADVAQIAGGDIDGALIGEALMRLDDPSALLASLVAAAHR